MKLYRGTYKNNPSNGNCWTDEEEIARKYMGDLLLDIEIDLGDFVIIECAGYDHEADKTPADDDEFVASHIAKGVDILIYDDEDEMGNEHVTYKMISENVIRHFQGVGGRRAGNDP